MHNRHYEKFADGRLKDIENEIPFDLPEGWAWCRLGEVCSILMGQSPESSFVSNNPDGMEFHQGKIYFTEKYIQKADNYTSNITKIALKNAILLCVRAPVGIVNITEREICIGRGLCSIYPKYKIQSEFWFYWLQCQKDFFEQKATGTTFKAISIEIIKNTLIPLPPLAEQQRIVRAIEAIFAQIDILEQNKTDLQTAVEQAKRKILDLAIHGKLVPQDPADEPASVMLEKLRAEKEAKIAAGEIKRGKNDSYIYKNSTDNCYYEKFDGKNNICIDDDIPFELPKNWQWCRLNELGDTNMGLTYHPEDLIDTGIPVLRSHNIQDEKLCLSDLARVQTKIFENQYVSNSNILICTRNGSKNLVGKCTIIENLPEKMAFGAFMAVFRSKLNPYILRYLQSFYFKDYLRKSNSTQIYQLTQNMLRNALIPIPPTSEQKRIIIKIEALFELLDKIQSNLV
ncbi:restriction endonuclease subunit S [Treponema socranskii]